jgi:replication factor A2
MYGRDGFGGNGGGFGGFSGFGGQEAQGGGGGFLGGFFASPQKGGEPGSPLGGRKDGAPVSYSRDTQGLMSVTIKMIMDASTQMDTGDSNLLRFHGNHEASMVELVGQVESVDESEGMYLRYLVDDGTGKITCKRLIESDRVGVSRMSSDRSAVGKYVRVIGSYRHFGNETYINAHKVEDIRNLDEISRHRIEVVHTMLLLTGQLDESSGAVSGMHASMSSLPSRESM